jgi:hypothetical protein
MQVMLDFSDSLTAFELLATHWIGRRHHLRTSLSLITNKTTRTLLSEWSGQ